MVIVATISAPSSSDVGEWFNVSGIVYDSATGYPIVGASVNLYYNGSSLGSATTGIDGDYLDSVRIDEAGYFELESRVGAAIASRFITITEPEPEPVITTVTISAPASANKNTSFNISGTVKDQFGVGVGGASVALFDNGSQFATVSTNSSGMYSRSTSIGSTGIHELAARSGGVYAWTDITITAPDEPEEPIISNITISAPSSHVEDSPFTVSGRVTDQYGNGVGGVTVAIYVNGTHVTNDTPDSQGYYTLNLIISSPGIYTLIAFAGTKSASRNITITEVAPAPPVITRVTIDAPASVDAGAAFTVSGFVLDQYNVGMGGVTVDLGVNRSYIGTVTTNSSGYYFKNTSISIAGVHELIAVAESGIFATRNITITAAPVGIPTTTTISAPSEAAVNERFNISGILYESEAGIPIPNQPINHSYNGRSLGSSTTGVDGNYLKEVSIPESGTWSLKSEFPGTDALQTSRALVDAVVAATPIETALLIAGPIVTGLALVIYGSK